MQLTSYSNDFIRHIYEGDLMKFSCYVYPLGNPPITWTWFCGEEEMKNVTFSSSKTTTYMNFTATRKHDWKYCYCRAKSPSRVLFYDHLSSSRYMMRVYHSPRSRPKIYPLTPTTVQSGEYINIKCNLTTVGYPKITWRWICGDQPPQNGMDEGTETYLEIKVTPRHNGKICRCRGISSPSSFYAYDEISDAIKITVFSTSNEDPQCVSAAAFGTTTGLLVAIILALITVLLLQHIRVKKGDLCSCVVSGETFKRKN
ncbi:uncharacterized protein LOC133179227 [Saccostrea echinata]|uniref:uncharacterized protein LOC133179227 n=1 Tax=Saccostrea echinata TaxID=191078 RepID=UPI002A7F703A|nr:uncharacterized protein LOC133179227 [Saccostrea echinata]